MVSTHSAPNGQSSSAQPNVFKMIKSIQDQNGSTVINKMAGNNLRLGGNHLVTLEQTEGTTIINHVSNNDLIYAENSRADIHIRTDPNCNGIVIGDYAENDLIMEGDCEIYIGQEGREGRLKEGRDSVVKLFEGSRRTEDKFEIGNATNEENSKEELSCLERTGRVVNSCLRNIFSGVQEFNCIKCSMT